MGLQMTRLSLIYLYALFIYRVFFVFCHVCLLWERHEHKWEFTFSFFSGSSYLQLDEEDFKEEQNSVARLIQMLCNDDTEEMFKVQTYYMLNPRVDIFRPVDQTFYSFIIIAIDCRSQLL